MEIKCKLCGKPINLEDFDQHLSIPTRMKKEGICFNCGYWLQRLDYDKDLDKGGKVAIITPDYEHRVSKTYGEIISVKTGTLSYTALYTNLTYIAAILDDGKLNLIKTGNIVYQGIIPEHLRSNFKVNAIILTPDLWKELQARKNLTSAYIKELIEKECNLKQYSYICKTI